MANEILQKIKQPEPSINQNNKVSVQQKTYNRPYVAPRSPARISTTPISDALCFKIKENPQIKYKFGTKKYSVLNFQSLLSIGAIICGIAAVFVKKK